MGCGGETVGNHTYQVVHKDKEKCCVDERKVYLASSSVNLVDNNAVYGSI